jgi:acetyl-CoA carboxylase carboxyl transferase subunit alpha
MAIRLKAVLLNELNALETLSTEELLDRRYKRLRAYGAFSEG